MKKIYHKKKHNVIFNHTLEEYNKKYGRSKGVLLKYSEQKVEDFDKKYLNYSNIDKNIEYPKKFLLQRRKWWFIDNVYYEIPKAPRFVWFRHLHAGIQVATCILGVGVIATSIAVPLAITLNATDLPIIDESVSSNCGVKLEKQTAVGNVYSVFPKNVGYCITSLKSISIGDDPLIKEEEYLAEIDNNNLSLTVKKEAFANHTGKLKITPVTDSIKIKSIEIINSQALLNSEIELNVNVYPSDALNKEVEFEIVDSDPEGNAIIVGNKLKTLYEGNVKVVAKAKDGSQVIGEKIIEINRHPVTGINLNSTSVTLNEGGANYILTPTIYPLNASNKNIIWTSSNEDTAICDNNGTIYPLSAGSSTITAKTVDGGFTATCDVTVQATTGINELFFSPVGSVTESDIRNIDIDGSSNVPWFYICQKGTYYPISGSFTLKTFPENLINLEINQYGAGITAKPGTNGGSGKIIVSAEGYKNNVLDFEVGSFGKLSIFCDQEGGPDTEYMVGAKSYGYNLGNVIVPSRKFFTSGSDSWWGKTRKIIGQDRGAVTFRDNTYLTSIYLPDTITQVTEGAFCWCSNLASIRIPSAVTTISDYDFKDCPKLNKFIIDKDNKTYTTKNNGSILFKKENSKYCLAAYPSASGVVDLTRYSSLYKLNKYSIFENRNVNSLKLPSSLKKIESIALEYEISNIPLNSVEFADTNGWKQTSGDTIDVTNPTNNAKYLIKLSSTGPNNWGYTGIEKD